VFYGLSPYYVMVGTVVWPANHIFLLVDSVTGSEGETSDNAGRLLGPLGETGDSRHLGI
jgi:hypothetical protein